MATVDVCTPMKGRVFSTKTAGGRFPLTPSPRASPRQQQKLQDSSPSIHTTPLFAHALPKSTPRKSAKSNIALANSPKRLDVGVSEWTLTGTGTPSKAIRTSRSRPQKSTVRIPYAAADRFLPNRAASDGLCNVVSKIDIDSSASSRRPKSSSRNAAEGSNILAAGAAGAFGIGGGRGS